MSWSDLLGGAVGFLISCIIGSFAEYFVHVLMHRRLLQGKVHTLHHKEGVGQGVWGEFLEYVVPAIPLPLLISVVAYFLGQIPFVVGIWIGYFFICFFCAYCHQASHEQPELMFWMRQPQHYIHHRDNMWWHNYGVSTSFWDHLFRTYKRVQYSPRRRPWQLRPRNFTDLKWF
jgi:sterol desaturase/sphingolipid hydroxylase (fatty acid hydroxylase superfamily)